MAAIAVRGRWARMVGRRMRLELSSCWHMHPVSAVGVAWPPGLRTTGLCRSCSQAGRTTRWMPSSHSCPRSRRTHPRPGTAPAPCSAHRARRRRCAHQQGRRGPRRSPPAPGRRPDSAYEALEARDGERRLRSLVRKASDLTVVCNAEAAISYVSPSALAVLGIADAELRGRPIAEILHPDDVSAHLGN